MSFKTRDRLRIGVVVLGVALLLAPAAVTADDHISHLWVKDDSESDDCQVCETECMTDDNGNRKCFKKCVAGKKWKYHWACAVGGETYWTPYGSCSVSSD